MAHHLAPAATNDLDEIWLRIAETGNIDAANRQADLLTERFTLIAQHPRIGRVRSELGLGLRSFSVADYVVLYRLQDKDVAILRVIHGRRDLGALFASS